MNLRKFAVVCRRNLRLSLALQVVLLIWFWFLGELLVHWTHLPIPGAIVGMLLVLGLLASGWISLFTLRRGAEWFLAEMLLFFIPAVPAVLNHREFLGWLGLKVLAVILLGTTVVMVITALAVDLCCRLSSGQAPAEKLP